MCVNLMGISELSQSIGASYIGNSLQDKGFFSVAIDSRNVKDKGLFFALKGNICDGHSFVKNAFDKGAYAAVVESSKLEKYNLLDLAQKYGKDLIVTDNSLKCLQDSARVYLEKFPNLVKVGITGSSGKTTTKEIACAIISCEKNTVMNKGNLNSETGLPLSVFEVRGCHEVGIFELGMNRKNEISEITCVLKPNIAAVTNIGTAHIEFFGSKSKILKEKKCIFNYLNKDDVAIIPKEDEYAAQLADGVNAVIRYYGAGTFDELEGTRSLGLEGTEIIWAGEKIHFPLPGKHSLHDALTAIAIAREIPVSNNAIKEGLESVKSLFGRLEIIRGRTTVIHDCYNANPESTAKSIEFCDSIDSIRKIYVIGDMLELGDASVSAHAHIGELLAFSKADKVFLFGSEITAATEYLYNANKDYFHTDDIEELSAAIDSFIKNGDLVLLKGSRGLALERLTDMLIGGNYDT